MEKGASGGEMNEKAHLLDNSASNSAGIINLGRPDDSTSTTILGFLKSVYNPR